MAGENAAEWSGLPADGEYCDFSKFDLAKAKFGAKPNFILPKKIPPGVSIREFSALPSEEKNKYFGEFSALLNPADRFVAWHKSGAADGLAITVEGGKSAELPIRADAGGNSRMHYVILLGKGASLDLSLESGSSNNVPAAGKRNNVPAAGKHGASAGGNVGSAPIHTDIIEALVGDDASLALTTLQSYPHSDLSFTHIFSKLGRFSRMRHACGIFGSATSRMRIENHLCGAHADVDSIQAFFMQGVQFSDLQASTYHHVPDTNGLMRAKGALSDSSRCAYKGYVKIDAGARNTITHQNGKALLLSKDASANVMPALDVENNEVEAGHGAAVGELSEEEMAYLCSRGISPSDARALIVEGFFDEMLSGFPSKNGKALLMGKLASCIITIKREKTA